MNKISDELRDWCDRNDENGCGCFVTEYSFEDICDLADRIDAEMVELPKDADGEYIRIGDEMEGVDKYDSLKKVMGKVITVSFESDGIVDVAIRAWNSDGKSWRRAYLDPDASVYRHYHAPTVEDVLREFTDEVWNRCCEGATASDSGIDELVAECAAKLRELVRGLDYCSDELNSAECDKCPLYDPADPVLEPKCVRMMRELGIEVGA